MSGYSSDGVLSISSTSVITGYSIFPDSNIQVTNKFLWSYRLYSITGMNCTHTSTTSFLISRLHLYQAKTLTVLSTVAQGSGQYDLICQHPSIYKLIDGDTVLCPTTSSIPPEMSSPVSYRPHTMHDLSGRVALVTGGGTGVGLKCVQGLAACGAKVYITGRRLDVLEKASAAWDKQIGGEILPYVDWWLMGWIHDSLLTPTKLLYLLRLQMDVTDKESILKVKTYIKEKEGKLHILVNKFVRSIYSWVGYWWLTLSYTQRRTARSHFAISQR